MIKIISITLIFFSIMLSCGKKGDPIYKDSGKKIDLQKVLRNKA